MTPTLKTLALVLALAPATAGAAQSLPPLIDNERVRTEFLAAAVGDEIRKHCSSITPRLMVVFGKVRDLERYAEGLGYTSDEIKAFRKSAENKARLKELRDAYLAANGVVAGNADSYCALGLREIENGTLIGSLLRAR